MKPVLWIILFIAGVITSCNSGDSDAGKQDSVTGKKEDPLSPEIRELYTQLQSHPDSAGLRLKLAISLDSAEVYTEALKQMDTLIRKDSLNFGLWYTNGRIAENAGDTLKAMQSYDRALRIYPSADAMLSLANLYAEQKNERALLICSNVRQLKLGREYDAHCDFISGVYNARTKNIQAALNFFDACVANNYTYMEAYIEKGLVYFDNKQYPEALNVFSFASTINALNPDPYYWQGRCYEILGIKDSAVLRFKQSLNLNRNDAASEEALKRLEQ